MFQQALGLRYEGGSHMGECVSRIPGTPIGTGAAPSIDELTELCQRILDGGEATREELRSALEIEPGTPQAKLLRETERTLAKRGNGGYGYIYTQIGLDATPCPGNCHFCDFAACNKMQRGRAEVPVDSILHSCELFAEGGAHLISLMTSAAYDFEKYLGVIERARAVVGDDIALMANTRDISLEEAQALRRAGADCLYHAIRLGEGVITGLDEDTRWRSLDNAVAAGLAVSTAAGPVYQSEGPDSPYYQTGEQIVDRMLRVLAYDNICSGVTSLHAVPGTKMENVKPLGKLKMQVVDGVFQLAARGTLPHGGCGSIPWIDAGVDPRARGFEDNDERIRESFAAARARLAQSGWKLASQGAMSYR